MSTVTDGVRLCFRPTQPPFPPIAGFRGILCLASSCMLEDRVSLIRHPPYCRIMVVWSLFCEFPCLCILSSTACADNVPGLLMNFLCIRFRSSIRSRISSAPARLFPWHFPYAVPKMWSDQVLEVVEAKPVGSQITRRSRLQLLPRMFA